jgi:hypothetical protein
MFRVDILLWLIQLPLARQGWHSRGAFGSLLY